MFYMTITTTSKRLFMFSLYRFLTIILACSTTVSLFADPSEAYASQEKLEEWINSPVDTNIEKYILGSEALPWDNSVILLFGIKGNMAEFSPFCRRFDKYLHGEDYSFLSNFYSGAITVDNRFYKSSEHYYQAMKFEFDSPIYTEIVNASDWWHAKYLGAYTYASQVNHVDDQEMARHMKKALWAKFVTLEGQPNDLGQLLIGTGDRLLVNGHRYIYYSGSGSTTKAHNISDQFLGMEFDFRDIPRTAPMIGQNLLGKLLMELRQILQ